MFWFLFFGLLTATNGILNSQNRPVVLTKARAESDYFLPDTLQPVSYEITIIPTFLDTTRDPRFDGSMRMIFSPKVSGVSSITLHVGTGLGVSQSTLRISSVEGEQLQITSIEIDNEVQMMTIFTNIELQVDKQYVLLAEFNGIVTIAGYGLFRGSYQEPNSNTTSYYLGTQLRPVYARQLFPCLDEPKYKARFTLTVLRPQDYVARSNMPLAAISPPDANGLVAIEFQQTPVMSPYLLTLFVFQFASEASLQDTNFFARYVGWSVPSKISQMRWSQQICPPLVDIAENYFNVPLYVPKMDQIALPQLVVIAMENWGINTYREINILADERSSMRQRQTVGRFTGHEVLHHWIGDLVTLEWWDYLWLQEAFAMYFEYFFPNVMDPSWRMMDQFIVDLTVEGLHGDNADSPLTSRVVTPQEVTNKFMGLTYTKGPALIRMLQHLMGEQNYQNGLKQFVSERRFLTMTPQQLWSTLQLFTPNINLNDLMSTWTDQGNFPVLFVFRDEKRNKLVIQQNDIDDYSKNGGNTKKTKLWQIPVSYTTKMERNFENTTPKFIMDKPISEFKLDTIVPCTDWIIFNLQFSGYYRVLYDHDNTQLLITQLHENHELIHPLNRAQLIDDSFVFAEKRIIQYNSAFSLVTYLYKEREYVPLRVALRAFNQLDQRLQMTSLYEVLRGFLNTTLIDVYLSIGFDDKFGEEPLQKLNREQIVQWSCYYDIADCRANALATFKRLQSTNSLNRLPGDTRPTIICYAAKSGDQQVLQNYIAPLYLSTDNGEINEAVNALACSDETSLGQILELPIPNDRWITLFGAILSRTENVYYGLNYLTSNLDKVIQRIGVTETANLIKQLQTKISLQGVTQQVMKNLRKNKMSNQQELQTPLNDLLNSIKTNDMWLKERYNDLKVTLFSYYAPPAWRNIPTTLDGNHNFVRAVPVQYTYQPEEYLIQ